MKSVIGGIILATLVSPAFANEFWVEYNYTTHECSIVEKKAEQTEAGTPQSGSAAKPTPKVASAPTAGTMPTILPGAQAPANTTVVAGSPGAPNDVTAPDSPSPTSDAQTTAPGTPTATNPDDNNKDPFAPLEKAWAQKKAAAEAAGTADVQTALIGSAQRSREEAEAEMQIMRKCGIAN